MIPLTLTLLALISATSALCPRGTTYDSTFDKCYQFISSEEGFESGEFYCNSIGGHLVAVQSAFENFYLSGMASSAYDSYWIGADAIMTSNWTWTTGDPMNYTNWAPGQPSIGPDGNNRCAAVRLSDNKWIASLCTSAKPYVCAVDPHRTTVGPTPTPTHVPVLDCSGLGCPSWTKQFTGDCKCYWYDGSMSQNWDWPQTKTLCAGDNGTLPIVRSADLDNFLSFTVRDSNWPGAIGLTCSRSGDPSSCVWIDGTPLLPGYSNFVTGQFVSEPKYQYVYKEEFGLYDQSWTTCAGNCGIATYCVKDPVHVSMLLEEKQANISKTKSKDAPALQKSKNNA